MRGDMAVNKRMWNIWVIRAPNKNDFPSPSHHQLLFQGRGSTSSFLAMVEFWLMWCAGHQSCLEFVSATGVQYLCHDRGEHFTALFPIFPYLNILPSSSSPMLRVLGRGGWRIDKDVSFTSEHKWDFLRSRQYRSKFKSLNTNKRHNESHHWNGIIIFIISPFSFFSEPQESQLTVVHEYMLYKHTWSITSYLNAT